VPQANSVDGALSVTVLDLVMMGPTRRIGLFRRADRADRSHVYQCLEMVNMEELAQRTAERFARIMLLNRTLVAFGSREEVRRPDLLLPTFGGHASVQDRGRLLVYDSCCDGEDAAAFGGSEKSEARVER